MLCNLYIKMNSVSAAKALNSDHTANFKQSKINFGMAQYFLIQFS